jgi:hypothetical protein
VAAPVTKEAGHRVGAARGKRFAQDVEFRHGPSIALATAAENRRGCPSPGQVLDQLDGSS